MMIRYIANPIPMGMAHFGRPLVFWLFVGKYRFQIVEVCNFAWCGVVLANACDCAVAYFKIGIDAASLQVVMRWALNRVFFGIAP